MFETDIVWWFLFLIFSGPQINKNVHLQVANGDFIFHATGGTWYSASKSWSSSALTSNVMGWPFTDRIPCANVADDHNRLVPSGIDRQLTSKWLSSGTAKEKVSGFIGNLDNWLHGQKTVGQYPTESYLQTCCDCHWWSPKLFELLALKKNPFHFRRFGGDLRRFGAVLRRFVPSTFLHSAAKLFRGMVSMFPEPKEICSS